MTIAPFTGPVEQTRYYDFHGIGIAITTDRPDVQEAMHIRFRHFAVEALPGAPELTFIFQGTAADQPPIDKPEGAGRPVYGLAQVDAVCDDALERLYIDRSDGFKAFCQANEGWRALSCRRKAPGCG